MMISARTAFITASVVVVPVLPPRLRFYGGPWSNATASEDSRAASFTGPSFRSGRADEFLLGCRPMTEPTIAGASSVSDPQPAAIVAREAGLQRDLTPAQLAMIGLGSSIGTGLFLGSAIAVKLAGPAVILSFIGGAGNAPTLIWAVAGNAAAHPAAGSFGLVAEMYLHS